MDLRAFAQRVGSQPRGRGRRRPARARGGLRAAQARAADGRARALRGPAPPPARRPRRRHAAPLPRRARASRSCSTPRSARSRPAAACAPCTCTTGAGCEAQILLVAAGIQPERRPRAKTRSWRVNRGLVVDDHMRTSDPAILAAGDVAEFDGQVPGLWPTAVAQAEVAAENAVGGDKAYGPVIPATILKVVGIELTSIGRIEAGAGRGGDRARGRAAGRYRKLVIADGPDRRRDPARPRQRRRRRADRDHARLRRQHAPGRAARGPLGRARAAQRRSAARAGRAA